MRSRSSTPRPEAVALPLALLALAAGCLDASRGDRAVDGGGKAIDGGDPTSFDAAVLDGKAAAPDAAIKPADVTCPSSSLAVATIDGDASDTAWEDASAPIAFDPDDSNLKAEVPDYQPDSSLTFRCLHTSQTLYFYFDVHDGDGASKGAIISSEEEPDANDALVLFLDGAGDRGGAYGTDDHWLLIDVGDKTLQSDGMPFTAKALPDADTRWRLEVAILLDAIAPGEVRGDVIGFDFALHDEDGFAGGSPDMQAFFAAEADAEIDGCDPGLPDPYCDTSQFATLDIAD